MTLTKYIGKRPVALIILTAVPNVYIDFKKPEEKALTNVTPDELARLFA